MADLRRPGRRRDATPLESLVARIDRARPDVPAPDTVPSGFPSLDQLLGGGLRRQDLIVLAGDVGSGKSALALGIALRAARTGAPVRYVSAEMSADRLRERALAIEGKAAVDDLRRGTLDETARAAVGAAAVVQRDLPLSYQTVEAEPAFEALEQPALVLPRPALVIADSLQLLSPGHASLGLEERVAAAAARLKSLAIRANIALLVVAHLPGHRTDRPDPRPSLDDLGGRGAVKQHADVVLALYREEMYRPGQGMEGATELVVLKNRNGPTGFADLYFHPRWLRFEDLLDRD
jgi:replicative DNA helicase